MPQHPKLRIVDLDLHDAEYDLSERMEEHHAIFGHYPPESPGEKCTHPMHDAVRREMNGMTLEIPFNPDEIVSDDSEVAREKDERYNRIYNATRQWQQQIELEEQEERARKAGLILPGRVY